MARGSVVKGLLWTFDHDTARRGSNGTLSVVTISCWGTDGGGVGGICGGDQITHYRTSEKSFDMIKSGFI